MPVLSNMRALWQGSARPSGATTMNTAPQPAMQGLGLAST